MANIKDKLKTRSAVKARKPTYKRVQANQFAKLANDEKWRRPKGMGNKDRRNRKGHIGMLKIGYGSPKEVRGLNKAGFEEVIVNNVKDLDRVDSKTQVAVISSTVGGKKTIEIINAADKKGLTIANFKDTKEKVKSLTKVSKETKTEKKVEKKESTKKADKKDTKKAEGENK